jgi:hypothetical protein
MINVVHTWIYVIYLPFCSENGYVTPEHGVVELQAQWCLSTLASMEPGPCRRSMPRELGYGDPSLRDSCSEALFGRVQVAAGAPATPAVVRDITGGITGSGLPAARASVMPAPR